jgi:hypothetical protein
MKNKRLSITMPIVISKEPKTSTFKFEDSLLGLKGHVFFGVSHQLHYYLEG